MKHWEKIEKIIENEIYEFIREIKDDESVGISIKIKVAGYLNNTIEQLELAKSLLMKNNL